MGRGACARSLSCKAGSAQASFIKPGRRAVRLKNGRALAGLRSPSHIRNPVVRRAPFPSPEPCFCFWVDITKKAASSLTKGRLARYAPAMIAFCAMAAALAASAVRSERTRSLLPTSARWRESRSAPCRRARRCRAHRALSGRCCRNCRPDTAYARPG